MKLIITAIIFLTSFQVVASDCKTTSHRCNMTTELTPDPSNPNSKLSVCIVYREIQGDTDLPEYMISGNYFFEGEIYNIQRTASGCGEKGNIIRTQCSGYEAQTWIERRKRIQPVQGYEMVLHVHAGQALSECTIGFVEAQTIHTPASSEWSWPDCR